MVEVTVPVLSTLSVARDSAILERDQLGILRRRIQSDGVRVDRIGARGKEDVTRAERGRREGAGSPGGVGVPEVVETPSAGGGISSTGGRAVAIPVIDCLRLGLRGGTNQQPDGGQHAEEEIRQSEAISPMNHGSILCLRSIYSGTFAE